MLTRTEESYLKAGLKYQEEKKFDEAINELGILVTRFPKKAINCYAYAHAQYTKGNYQEAIKYFQLAIELEPTNENYYNACAFAYYKNKQPDNAVLYHEKAIALNPENPESFFLYATTCVDNKQYDLAIKHYKKAIALKPDAANYHAKLGKIYTKLENHKAAITCYEAAIKLNPDEVGYYHYCARACKSNNELERAQQYFIDAQEVSSRKFLETKNTAYITDKVIAHFEIDPERNAAKSIQMLEAAMKSNPSEVQYHNLGYAYFTNGNFSMAVANYCEAISMDHQGAHEKLYQLIKGLKIGNDLSDMCTDGRFVKLRCAILKQPDRNKRSELLGYLLDSEHPMGICCLQFLSELQNAVHKLYYIQGIINDISSKAVAEKYLTRALVLNNTKLDDHQDILYKMCHPKNQFSFWSHEKAYVDLLTKKLDSIRKSKANLSPSAHFVRIVQEKEVLEIKFSSLLRKINETSDKLQRERMSGYLIRHYDAITQLQSGVGILPMYRSFIEKISVEELFRALVSEDFPEIKMPLENRQQVLLSCLDSHQLLGQKFLNKDNKKIVEKIIMALPEDTPEARELKIAVIKRARFEKGDMLFVVCNATRFGGSVSDLKPGTLQNLAKRQKVLEEYQQNLSNLEKEFYDESEDSNGFSLM